MRTVADRNGLLLLAGFGLGAAAMYIFDPGEGRRRRALVRDKGTRALHQGRDVAGARARDLRNRGAGLVASVGSRLTEEQPSDEVVVERVRSAMGHWVSHPASLEVAAQEGHVELSGPIIAREVEPLLSRVRKVRGVRSVRSRLEAHDRAADVPGLQGAPERLQRDGARRLLEQSWPLGAGLVAGALLAELMGGGVRLSGRLGALVGLAGAALLAGSVDRLQASSPDAGDSASDRSSDDALLASRRASSVSH